MHLFDVQFRSVEHQIPLIAVGLRETKDLEFKPNFKVSTIIRERVQISVGNPIMGNGPD